MRVLVFNLGFYGGTFLFALIAIMFARGKQRQNRMRGFLRAHARFVQRLVRLVLGGRIEVRGLEHLPADGPAILAPKHQSELDVFIPLAMFPDLAAIAMAELTRYPLLGPVLRALDFILVTVEGPRKNQLGDVVSGAERVHAQGRTILIYPEGELMKLGARERYKSGVFHIYETLGVPVTPAAQSLGLIWPQRQWRKSVGATGVWEFLKPIPPGLDKDTFMAELESRIEERTMALIREHGDPETVALAEERFRLGHTNADAPPLRGATDMAALAATAAAGGARPAPGSPQDEARQHVGD